MPNTADTQNPVSRAGRFRLRRRHAAPPGRVRVLIVDDHALFAEALEIALEADARIDVAGRAVNGVEAVEAACTLRPDVVLMDLEMPVLDGVEATRQIRCELPACQVVVVTGSSDPEDERRALNAGAVAYLRKGCPTSELLAAAFQAVGAPPAERSLPVLARVHPCAA